MKKRGVTKRKAGSSHAAARAKNSRKAASRRAPKMKQRKAAKPAQPIKRRRPSRPKAAVPSTLHSADSEFRSEERFIRKEVRWLFGKHEFHVTTFVLSLIVLAFLLHSFSIIFYTLLTIGALLFAHFLKEHHRPHDVITIIGLFFLPLAFTLMAFRDWFAWLLLVVYSISVISTVIIYYYHKKAHTPLKIMWQVVYSKIIAITLAVILLCVLPFIFPDAFLSMFELFFLYALPVVFVFFFASKFFYLYFFDRKHIRHDMLKSLRFTIIYSLVFLVLVMCIYSLFAAGVYRYRAPAYEETLDTVLFGISSVEKTIMNQPGDVSSLMVMKDVSGFASGLGADVSLAKSRAAARELSFAGIADDSYIEVLVNDSFDTLRFVILQVELVSLKADVLESYEELKDMEDPELYASGLRNFVEENFVPFSQDPEIAEVLVNLNNPHSTFSEFENQGFFYWFEDESGLTVMYHSDSIFGRQMGLVLKHTQFFRQMTRLVLNSIIFMEKESVSAASMEHIYANQEADLLPLSSAVRYSVLGEYVEESAKRAGDSKTMVLGY